MPFNLKNTIILTAVILFSATSGVRYFQYSSDNAFTTKPDTLNSSQLSKKTVLIANPQRDEIDKLSKSENESEEIEIDDLIVEEHRQKKIVDSEPKKSEVKLANGLLSIDVNNAPLTNVLVQISNATGVTITTEAINPSHFASITINNISIEAALAELLSEYDYFLFYKGKRKKLKAAWIYPSGTGETVALIPEESSVPQANENDFYSSNPDSRVLALQHSVLTNKNGDSLIYEALSDDDPDVRATAILSAQENALNLSTETLIEMTKKDPSSLVRSAALNALSMNTDLSDEEIIELAESALKDSEETIREEAEAIIEGIEEKNNSSDPLNEAQPDLNGKNVS